MLLSYSISGRLLLILSIMSHMENHLSVLYDKIPVFYAIKYRKFATIAFIRQRDDQTPYSYCLTALYLFLTACAFYRYFHSRDNIRHKHEGKLS